jgi:hypothetical protein
LRSAVTLVSSVTPGAGAEIRIIALDTQIAENNGPVRPATVFVAGFTRIYYFVTYKGMQSGVLWRRELVKDGVVIDQISDLWRVTTQGEAYFLFGARGGFGPGQYEIRIYIGGGPMPASAQKFTVSGQ